MGRELKRVPLDFDWPLTETWEGYLNPFYRFREECEACHGSGYSVVAKMYTDQWYGSTGFDPAAYGAVPLTVDHPEVQAFATRNVDRAPEYYLVEDVGRARAIAREAGRLFGLWKGQWQHHLIQADVDALIARGRLMDFTHVPRNEEQARISREKVASGGNSWLPEPNGYHPTASEVNDWSFSGMGHDGINQFVCVRARCERDGEPVDCAECEGHGEIWPTKAHKALYESYDNIEPPTGDGFQLWESTSEGSPTSPVFPSLGDLCEWAAENATTFGSMTATAEEWYRMLGDGLVVAKQGNAVFL